KVRLTLPASRTLQSPTLPSKVKRRLLKIRMTDSGAILFMSSIAIDMRSDTVTKPTPGMRRAMAEAEVGDDMSGEDPTVNRLEALMADLLGEEDAVYACSGTQSNQMGVRTHCQPGDELLIESTGHIANFEQ